METAAVVDTSAHPEFVEPPSREVRVLLDDPTDLAVVRIDRIGAPRHRMAATDHRAEMRIRFLV
ncbi:hypothetical protein [Rhodococcus globerulus]|uniref:Uncharacterized protein n=1 Tax=Rhodococcus globerulus TaxID=33008 RepID=A0ABU4C5D4_RHOGO|nr:hypothetical protein [Rhodococcus globerulus]MDV6271716.1 hypothetical protein [Rhodococcus globerulus]